MDGATARLNDERLIGSGVHRQAAEKGKRGSGGSAAHRDANGAGLVGGRWRTGADAHICVALLCHGVGYGHLVLLRVIGNQRIGVGLESHGSRAEKFRSTGTGGAVKRATCVEDDGGHRLIERIQQINLRSIISSGVGVGNGRRSGNRIDGDALRSLREANNNIGAAEIDLTRILGKVGRMRRIGRTSSRVICGGVQRVGKTIRIENALHRKGAIEGVSESGLGNSLNQHGAGIPRVKTEGLSAWKVYGHGNHSGCD